MKYFKDNEILYENFYIISKYCPISNSNVDTIITDMNNIELSSDFDSSNEVYNINNINNILILCFFFYFFLISLSFD